MEYTPHITSEEKMKLCQVINRTSVILASENPSFEQAKTSILNVLGLEDTTD